MHLSFKPFLGKAPRVESSQGISYGRKNNRIHLVSGKEDNKDIYAIAAEAFVKTSPKLNYFEKKFYILHAHMENGKTAWYNR